MNPFSQQTEIFRWGPVPIKLFYMGEFNRCLTTLFPKNYPGHSWPKTLFLKNENRMVWLNDHKKLREHGESIFLKYMLSINQREKARTKWKKDRQKVIEFERRIDKMNFALLSNKKFIKVWHDFHQWVIKFWTHAILPELSNYGSSELLQKKLMEHIKDDGDLMSAMEVLTAPLGISFYQQEEIDLDEAKDISDHQKRYFWLKNSFARIEILDMKFFRERKKKLSKCVKKKVAEALENARKKKEEVRIKYALPKKVMDIADAITDAILWQDARKKDILIFLYYKDLLLSELAKRYVLSKEALLDFDSREIENLLRKDIKKEIKKREKAFGILLTDAIQVIDTKTALRYWNLYAEEKVSEHTQEIKGIIASKGVTHVVKGTVKIVLDPYNLKNFNEGDILVTAMTTPEFVFVMKKSLAIITDTGGLTSHAAIVSRELGIPCIVGTKIGSKVLKDGDLVEVDANKGIVRKL